MNEVTRSDRYLLRVQGPRAFFPRPEFSIDRVSYDFIPPRAARGIFDAICWAHVIRWTVHAITALAPLKIQLSDGGWAGLSGRSFTLHDVDYLLEADFELLIEPSATENVGKYNSIFNRSLKSGRYRRRPPHLGTPEFLLTATLLDTAPRLQAETGWEGERDLGWLPFDGLYSDELQFFRAVPRDGCLHIPARGSPELFR